VGITKELPTVISFCSGYGGIERGLDLAGFEHRVIAYVEIEAFAIANLVNKMEAGQLPPAPIYTNLKTFPAHLFRDRVDLITGGYPCQPFSAAGQRKGTDDPRHLWPFIRRHIESIRPVQCFFENVEGHISLGLSSVISDLEEDGYRATWGIFSAREVGAPHQRKRVYIMGDSKGLQCNGGSDNREYSKCEISKPRDSGGSRLDLGNSEHYGLSSTEVRGGACSTSNNTAQRQDAASKSERTSKPNCGGNLSGAEILADSAGKFSERRIAEGVASWKPEEAIGGRGAFESVADTNSASWQGGGLPSGVHEENPIAYSSGNGVRAEATQQWPPEPRVGRVVDGCADRVDRLRLLGNGVVPQTAAKAWNILSKRLN